MKIGHGGTLDPLATGVLITGVGKGTKALQDFLNCTKVYEAVVLFGTSTDTYDRVGKVLKRAPYAHITKEMVEDALEQFRGKLMQLPPLFSALKMNGKPLYEYAREGKEIPREIERRPVEVLNLEMLEWMEGGTHEHVAPTDEAGYAEVNVANKLWEQEKAVPGTLKGKAEAAQDKSVEIEGQAEATTADTASTHNVEGTSVAVKEDATDAGQAETVDHTSSEQHPPTLEAGAFKTEDIKDEAKKESQADESDPLPPTAEELALSNFEQKKRKLSEDQDDLVHERPASRRKTAPSRSSTAEAAMMSGGLSSPSPSPLPSEAADTSPPTKGPPAARLRMTVTSGFYVRSLCHDLGAAVGSAALMAELKRTRQGDFTLGTNVLEWEDLAQGEKVWGPQVEKLLDEWHYKHEK